MAKRAPAGEIARLRITLQDIEPEIWRRLEVPAAISMATLHDTLQIAFRWTNSHLHQFEIGDRSIGMLDEEAPPNLVDERKIRLDQLLPVRGPFLYEYDLGDSWIHGIEVEDVFRPQARVTYPRCTGGEGAAPPEDCGGPSGYAGFLEALRDPNHEEHESMLEWIGGSFDPEAFDLVEVNRALKRLRLS